MSAQITWRNVDAPNLGEALRPLMGAQQSFNTSLEGLARVLVQREATDAANWQTQKNNNTQGFLDTLYAQYKTPEALAAARQSGELDRMAAGFGAQVDRGAIRGAADTRLNTLYQQAQAADAYSAQQRETRLVPLAQQAQALVAKNDQKGLETFLAANPELMQFKGGDLIKAGVVSARDAKRFGWDEAQATRLAERAPLELQKLQEDIKNAGVNRTVALGNLAVNQGQLGLAQTEARIRAEERLVKQLNEAKDKYFSTNSTIASADGQKYVLEQISKTFDKDPETRQELTKAFMQMVKDEQLSSASPSAALNALIGDSDNLIFREGSGAPSELRKLITSPGYTGQAAERAARRKGQEDEILNLEAALAAARGQKAPAASPADAPAPVPTPEAAAARLVLPPPTPVPSNQRPNRGPARFPWETTAAPLPGSAKTGDRLFDEVMATQIQKMADEGLLPKTQAGAADFSKISEKQLKEIRKQLEESTLGKPVLPK